MPFNPFDFIGKAVHKHFPNYGWFGGLVLEVVSVRGTLYFRVEYEDGDIEDVPFTELAKMLDAKNAAAIPDAGQPELEKEAEVEDSDKEPKGSSELEAANGTRTEQQTKGADSPAETGRETTGEQTGIMKTAKAKEALVAKKTAIANKVKQTQPALMQEKAAVPFSQENLQRVRVDQILDVMEKYTHRRAKSNPKLLLLEAVATFTFMLDEVNKGKVPKILSELENEGVYNNMADDDAEDDLEDVGAKQANDEDGGMETTKASVVPMVPVPRQVANKNKRSARILYSQEGAGADASPDGGKCGARRSKRYRVPPKRFRDEEKRAAATSGRRSNEGVDGEGPSSSRRGSHDGNMSFPNLVRRGTRMASKRSTCAQDPDSNVETVLTLGKDGGLTYVEVVREGKGGGGRQGTVSRRRVPRKRPLREILAQGKKRNSSEWKKAEVPKRVPAAQECRPPSAPPENRISPGSSHSTDEEIDVDTNTARAAPNWQSRPGVCNPRNRGKSKRKPEVTLVIRDLVAAGLIHLGDKVQFRWTQGQVLAEGWLTRVGIICSRCARVVSCVEFGKCAGRRVRNPSAYIYVVSEGKPETWRSIQDLEVAHCNLSMTSGAGNKKDRPKTLSRPNVLGARSGDLPQPSGNEAAAEDGPNHCAVDAPNADEEVGVGGDGNGEGEGEGEGYDITLDMFD